MKKTILISESELINLIENLVFKYGLINEARASKYDKSLTHLYKITFPDGSTYYGISKSHNEELYKNYLFSMAKNNVKGHLFDMIKNSKYSVDVNKIFSSKNSDLVSQKKSEFIKSDTDSINKNKYGVKKNYTLSVLPLDKKYVIKDSEGNLFVSSILVSSNPVVKSRVNMLNSLYNKGVTYYKIKNPDRVNLVGNVSLSLIDKKPEKTDVDDGNDVLDYVINKYIKNKKNINTDEPSLDVDDNNDNISFNVPSLDVGIDDGKNEKKRRGRKPPKNEDIPTEITPETILDFVINKGYETLDDWKNDKIGGGNYLYNKAVAGRFIPQITQFFYKSKKPKMVGKGVDKKPLTQNKSNQYYTSTSTKPNISFNYKIKESIRKILKTML